MTWKQGGRALGRGTLQGREEVEEKEKDRGKRRSGREGEGEEVEEKKMRMRMMVRREVWYGKEKRGEWECR